MPEELGQTATFVNPSNFGNCTYIFTLISLILLNLILPMETKLKKETNVTPLKVSKSQGVRGEGIIGSKERKPLKLTKSCHH